MKERKVNFEINDDPTPVLDPDGEKFKKLEAASKDLIGKFSLMLSMLKDGNLTEGLKEANISLFESRAIEILNELGYEGSLNQKHNEFIKEIRSLYEENNELRRQCGMKASNEDVRERFKIIYDSLSNWWEKEGTNYIEDITLNRYELQVCLKGSFFRSRRKTSEEQVNALKEKGFDIAKIKNFGYYLLATEKNFTMLKDMLNKHFPHSELESIETKNYIDDLSKPCLIIERIKFCIFDLNDIKVTEDTSSKD